MPIIWKKRSQKEIKSVVMNALQQNVNYEEAGILGVPSSFLDEKVFNQDATFLKDAPFISAMVQNPNHIGCHTLGKSEPFFEGTQDIERELIEICGVDILKGKIGGQDGYVASGGTEANMQAIWVYRNYFRNEFSATNDEICILCSEDSHYSMNKASNVMMLDVLKIQVEENTRQWTSSSISETMELAKQKGKKYFITICNMMTTMFGSVDDVDLLVAALKSEDCEFKIHVDGAFGGFYYPFTNQNSRLSFEHPDISSFTLDAHKMAQAPYGTGIFIIRKGLIHHVNTKEASYVEGEDFTLIGSRSGANAVAVWMILVKNGPYGWHEKLIILQKRAEWICKHLGELGIVYYRNPFSNIITIKSEFVENSIVQRFGLVPDNHSNPKWYKIVIMEHVSIEKLSALVDALGGS